MEKFSKDQIIELITNFRSEHPNGVVVIWGATTTWKTRLSLELAQTFPIEVISADSRQVYKYMDIWTDKLSREDQQNVPHHCIDIVLPDQTFTAGQRKKYAIQAIGDIQQRKKIPVIVWGTGLYIDMLYRNYAMPEIAPQPELRSELYEKERQQPWRLHAELQRLDPEEAQKHHANSLPYLVRALEIIHVSWTTKTALAAENAVEWPLLMLWLRRDKDETNKKINKRIGEMLEEWLITEVQRLLDNGYGPEAVAMQGIWYKEIVWYLQWVYDLERAVELLKRNTHHLAKKQRTRFRRYIMDAKMSPKANVTYRVFEVE